MRKGFAVNLEQVLKVNGVSKNRLINSQCFLCSADNEATVCSSCFKDLLRNADACPACARPGSANRVCATCLEHPWAHINQVWCMFQYHYPLNHLIHNMKFKQGVDTANYIGRALAAAYSKYQHQPPDCIMPVPLHKKRLMARGYNQSLELARPLSKMLGVALDTNSCKRTRATTPQTNLPANKRKNNVRNAFSVVGKTGYEHVLLIDDVITTGSTINELARILKLAGVKRIDVVACARAT